MDKAQAALPAIVAICLILAMSPNAMAKPEQPKITVHNLSGHCISAKAYSSGALANGRRVKIAPTAEGTTDPGGLDSVEKWVLRVYEPSDCGLVTKGSPYIERTIKYGGSGVVRHTKYLFGLKENTYDRKKISLFRTTPSQSALTTYYFALVPWFLGCMANSINCMSDVPGKSGTMEREPD